MISRRTIISGSAGLIFTIFSLNESDLAADDRSGPLFPISQGTLSWQPILWKMANSPLSLLWHYETKWDIATSICALNFRITEPNLTKFLQCVQKWLQITLLKSKLRSSKMQSIWKRQRNEWRSSSNCGRIAAIIAHFNSVNSEITEQKFTKFGHDVTWLLPLNPMKADLWSANMMCNAEAKCKFVPCDVCEHLAIFYWLP